MPACSYLSKAGTIKNTVKADVTAIRRAAEDQEHVRQLQAQCAELAALREELERLRREKVGEVQQGSTSYRGKVGLK